MQKFTRLLVAIAFGFSILHISLPVSKANIIPKGIKIKLSQAISPSTKAKQSEARAYILALNRMQHAFHLEKQRFARSGDNVDDLIVVTEPKSRSYTYSTKFIDRFRLQNIATPNEKGLRAYTGGVFLTKIEGSLNYRIPSLLRGLKPYIDWMFAIRSEGSLNYSIPNLLCEANKPTEKFLPVIKTIGGYPPRCPSGFSRVYPEYFPPSNEAIFYIGLMNRAQQAFYLEKNRFATTFSELELGIDGETENYIYKVIPIDRYSVQNIAISKNNGLTTYTGEVLATKLPNSREGDSITVLCKSNKPTSKLPPPIEIKDGYPPLCPVGYSVVN